MIRGAAFLQSLFFVLVFKRKSMQRRLNYQFLGWSTAITMIVIVALLLLHHWQRQRHVDDLLLAANQAMDRGNIFHASMYFSEYLDLVPSDTKALIAYGLALNKMANSSAARYRAYLILEQSLRRQPENHELLVDVTNIAMQLSRYEDAERYLKELVVIEPLNDKWWQKLGEVQRDLGEYANAKRSFSKAIEIAPNNLEHFIRLGNLLQNQMDRAVDVPGVLDDMIRHNPNSYQAYLAKANYFAAIGRTTAALKPYEKAYELAPESAEVLVKLIEYYRSQGEITKATELLETMASGSKTTPVCFQELAFLQIQQGQSNKALTTLEKGLSRFPESKLLKIVKADFLVSVGKTKEAKAILAKMDESDSPGVADCLRARLLMNDGKWFEALNLLLKVEPELIKQQQWQPQIWQLLAQCFCQLGDYETALRYQHRVMQLAPNWPLAQFTLADIYVSLGHWEDAVRLLQQIQTNPLAPKDTSILLAKTMLLQKQRGERDSGRWREIRQLIDSLAKKKNDPFEILLLRAEYWVGRGDYNQATKILLDSEKQFSDKPRLYRALADVEMRKKNFAVAKQWLQRATEKFPEDISLVLGWLRYWQTVKNSESIKEINGLLTRTHFPNRYFEVQVRREAAKIFLNLKDQVSAIQQYRLVSEILPNDIESRVALFELAILKKDQTMARHWLNSLNETVSSADVYKKYCKAAYLYHFGENTPASLAEMRSLLSDQSGDISEFPRVAWLRGLVEERAKDIPQALMYFLKATRTGDLVPEALEHVVNLLLQQGRELESDLLLRQLEEKNALKPEFATIGAEIALQNRNYERAIHLAKIAVPEDCRDYRRHLWLGRILLQSGKTADAEATLKKAVEQTPEVPDTWISWFRYLHDQNRNAEAESFLKGIDQKMPEDLQSITKAKCLEALGQTTRAENLILDALKKSPDDLLNWQTVADFYLSNKRFDKAEPWLRKIIAPVHQLPGEMVQQAKRNLAYALANQTPAKLDEAKALLVRSKERRDRLALAMVLAHDPASREEAFRILNDASLDPRKNPDEVFELAKLLATKKDFEPAAKLLGRLISIHGEKKEYLLEYIPTLLKRKDLDLADFYIKKLAQSGSDAEAVRAFEQQYQAALKSLKSNN